MLTPHAAIVVGFSQGTYAVRETVGQVLVCAGLAGMTARDVGVSLSTSSGTAVGGLDYTSITGGVRVFPPASQTDICWSIAVENDNLLEGTEAFLVSLSTNDSQVILNPDQAQVTILENDSKLKAIYLHYIPDYTTCSQVISYCVILLFDAAASIDFERTLYMFSEEDSAAEVCVTLTGSIQVSVSVQIHSNDTAQSGTCALLSY